MGFSFYLYRGPKLLPPITRWESNMGEPIGSGPEIRDALSHLLPSVVWESSSSGHTFGRAIDPRYDVGHSLATFEQDGVVLLISTSNHASPFTLAKIMDRFSLNYCCTEFGDFRDPHASDDDWRPKRPA